MIEDHSINNLGILKMHHRNEEAEVKKKVLQDKYEYIQQVRQI